MLVIPSHRKLVLDTPRLADVKACIPHAAEFTVEGNTMLVINHGVEEVRVLKNMGFSNVIAPIEHYYDWPGQHRPRKHQIATASFLTMYDRALCLNAPGTGKTICCLWAADYLIREGLVKRPLIVAPLSTLKNVWGKEIAYNFCSRRTHIVAGEQKRKRQILSSVADGDFTIINHDGFTVTPKDLLQQFDLIIYDEATAIKSAGSRRYKHFARHMLEFSPLLWLLTGTPISQNPTDAWTLGRLTNPSVTPRSFTQFKDMVMKRVTKFKWVPRAGALDVCKKVLQPSIRYSLDECTDIPDTVYILRECTLSKQQQAAYAILQSEAHLVMDGNVISAANAAVLFGKLLQLCCGIVYDEQGEGVEFDAQDRLDTLTELVAEIGDKLIIFVPLRSIQDHLVQHLSAQGYDVASVHGGVTPHDRNEIFTKFQETSDIQILVAHPKVAAHGLTLTKASSIIWYAPIHSLEMYEQANARIRRISTTKQPVVFHIAATGFERELYRRLATRQRVLADFLNLVRGENT